LLKGENKMKAILAILGGLGVGAALMYIFDPDGGNRRRALIRDKATKFNRQTREAIEGRAKDISNRTKGLIHEMKSASGSETRSGAEEPITFS
jgi:hypothetical protein